MSTSTHEQVRAQRCVTDTDGAIPGCETRDQSRTLPGVPLREPLTLAYWGLELGANLPCQLRADAVIATRGELVRVAEFIRDEFPSLVEDGLCTVFGARIQQAKHHHLSARCDLFEMRHHERTVAVIIGEPDDWSSYYIRALAVAHSYQHPALVRRFIHECLDELLTSQRVERVLADTSPANIAMATLLTEFRFHVTGHQLSERWGPLIRFTRFLDPDRESAFLATVGAGEQRHPAK